MTITNYTIKQPIGQGGMATVYLAEHNILQKPVAIKILNKEYVHNDNIRKRFLAEAKNLFGMSHPNIIKVTDLIDAGDTVAFVMEYIEGETLKEYLERKGKLNDEEIKTLFSQMLEAVGYVHEQNLVHRDIKPSNFMITPQGKIKLLDFGIAKNTDSQSSDYTQTGTTQNMGTPMYMSPEQIKSTKDVTLQSDIYSLGVVLWQMVMGKKPYDTNTTSTFELQMKIVTEKLTLTNSSFDTIIAVATAKELNFRYKNSNEIKTKLENLQKQNFESTKPYITKDSERTIVDSSKDKTVIESKKDNNNTPRPVINVPPYSPPQQSNNSNVGYLIGILVIIILGTLFWYVNRPIAEEAPIDYQDVTPAIEETPAAPSEAAPDYQDVTTTKAVSFTNKSSNDLWLAYAFYDSGWQSHGWIYIGPNTSKEIYLPVSFTENSIYWYAEDSEGSKWEGSDGNFCIKNPGNFDLLNANENCSLQAGFYKLDLTGTYTTQSLTN